MTKELDKNLINEILEQEGLFKTLLKSKPSLQKLIINKVDKKIILFICIIVLNILKGNISIKKSEIDKLKRFKLPLRKLTSISKLKDKKKILQRGGFLSTLIPLILNAIISLS